MLGLSVRNSRKVCVDIDLLTWQVLLGGLGSGVRARGHLHLRAEHGGSCLGALLRGGPCLSRMGPPWHPQATLGGGCLDPAVNQRNSIIHKDGGETNTFCLLRLVIGASASSKGFWCNGEESAGAAITNDTNWWL